MTPEISGEGVLGKTVKGPRRQLDTFDLPKSNQEVVYTSDEVSSLCPITGQPDWYTISIQLFLSPTGIESKSLKLYLQSFREEGVFCEEFAHVIAYDVLEATKALGVTVEVLQKPRGGVSIKATSLLRVHT